MMYLFFLLSKLAPRMQPIIFHLHNTARAASRDPTRSPALQTLLLPLLLLLAVLFACHAVPLLYLVRRRPTWAGPLRCACGQWTRLRLLVRRSRRAERRQRRLLIRRAWEQIR